MRIVTRPDFDGVVCAALLHDVLDITGTTLWVEPNEMQRGDVAVTPEDVVANLPFHPNCGIWFDHHYTNRPDRPFAGDFRIAPSAAGIVYAYYRDRFTRDYDELIAQTDKVDAADLSEDEVLHPENYPYILLSMTVSGRDSADDVYWNHLTQLLRRLDIDGIHRDEAVRNRCREVIDQNNRFRDLVRAHTRVVAHVSITDFRSFAEAPRGNRFLVYSLFPAASVSVKIRRERGADGRIIIGVGHSIFNRTCQVNVGLMLSEFGGGGHRGAGSCTVSESGADEAIARIREILIRNQPNEA